MEEKLVKVLLDQYREQGIDMYALLDDDFFKRLRLASKVSLIKKYASHISSGTGRTLSKKDIRNLAIDAGFSGLLTGLTAGMAAREATKYFVNGKVPMGAILGAVAVGATLSAGGAYLNAQKKIKNRADILKQIDNTSTNPTDENALKVLTTRNNQLNPIALGAIRSSTSGNISSSASRLPSVILGQIDPLINYLSFKKNYHALDTEFVDGHDNDTVWDLYRKSAANSKNSFEKSMTNMTNNLSGN